MVAGRPWWDQNWWKLCGNQFCRNDASEFRNSSQFPRWLVRCFTIHESLSWHFLLALPLTQDWNCTILFSHTLFLLLRVRIPARLDMPYLDVIGWTSYFMQFTQNIRKLEQYWNVRNLDLTFWMNFIHLQGVQKKCTDTLTGDIYLFKSQIKKIPMLKDNQSFHN